MDGANLFFGSAGAGGCGGRGGSVLSVGRQDLHGERGARVKWSRRHRHQLRNLFRWLLAIAEERDKYVDRTAALAAGLLLNGCGQVAGLYLSERLAKRVKTDERNFADEVVCLKSHWRAQRHIVIRADNQAWEQLHTCQR